MCLHYTPEIKVVQTEKPSCVVVYRVLCAVYRVLCIVWFA